MTKDKKERITIKALGDWELDVLAVPFGDESSKDSDGEYFNADTNFYLENYTPPAFFYHGFNENGAPMGEPAMIGKTESSEVREDGVWLRVILDKASELAGRVWESAKEGLARASSGSINHLVRKDDDGKITNWPLAEISLFDMTGSMQPANQYAVAVPVMKANYEKAGIELPEWVQEQSKGESKEIVNPEPVKPAKIIKEKTKEKKMSEEKDLKDLIAQGVKDAMKDADEAREATKAQKALIKDEIEKGVEEEKKKIKEAYAKDGRLPFVEAPAVAKFSQLWKYDNVDAGALALGITIMNKAKNRHASEDMYKALAMKMIDKEEHREAMGSLAMKMDKALKGDEIMYATLSSYGDEWVGVEYSRDLWKKVRLATPILAKMPQMEIPQGNESSVIPLESTDPTWYKVAEATDHTSSRPDVTVTASQAGTANKTITVGKLGARVDWSGELGEDSLIPMLPQLREQLIVSGAEALENAIINGDDATATVTNINDIAGTPAGTEVFMMFDGFRLVGLTNNSRDAGSHDVDDYLLTMKEMGNAGINGLDINKTAFIIGPQEYYSLLREEEVKTQDVFSKATLENGNIVGLWGRPLIVSNQMCAGSDDRLSNTAGKVDIDTTTNNTKGSIVAVRWDQWKFAWKRRMTIEVDRWPESDTNMIVAMIRCGLGYRDTAAAAVSYNVTV